MPGQQGLTLEERFWSKVDRSGDCWIWTASRLRRGYGQFGLYKRRMWKAHRVAWELTYGDIPPGLCVCHRCDNPPCVRPDHLFLGTFRDNNADCKRKARTARGDRNGARIYPERLHRTRGENHAMAKLTHADVTELRLLRQRGFTQKALAARFGISQTQVFRIVHGTRWAP